MPEKKRLTLSRVVKVFIYVFFGLGLLWGVNLLGGLALSLRHADDLGQFKLFPLRMSNLYEIDRLPRSPELPSSLVSRDGAARLDLEAVYGQYRYRKVPRLLVAAAYFSQFCLLGLYLLAVVQLANLFENLGDGRFFEAENPCCVRRAGWAVTISGLLDPGLKFLWLWLFQGSIAVGGASTPWFFLLSEIRPEIVLAGLALLAFAEVFRRGVALREEQDLTV